MARAFVVCGVALILIAHVYFFNIMPFTPPEVEGAARPAEETQLYAFTVYLISAAGLLLVQLAGLPRAGARRRGGHAEEEMEEAGNGMDSLELLPRVQLAATATAAAA